MKISQILEYRDMCNVCGQTPCNCTHVTEGADERGQKRLWAQITDYEKRAKATSNDIKKQHLLKMADELRGKLKTSDLNEFAPVGGDDREPDEEEILRQLAARWWLGTEQQMAQAQRTLDAMGWEIGPDESGDEDAGVFLIRPGDEHGSTYIAFNHSDLSLDEAKKKKKKKSSRSLRGYFFPGYAYYGSGESGEGGGDGGGESINRAVAEGDVVQFPKKHKGDLDSVQDCPKCGGDLQGGTYMGHQVKVCIPCKQVYLPPNSGIDQHGNKIKDEGVAEGYGEDDGIYIGAKVYHKEHQSGEPFEVVKILDDQRVGVVDEYGNKKAMFIDKLVPVQQGVAEGDRPGMKDGRPYSDPLRRHPGNESYMTPDYLIQKYQERLAQIAAGQYKRPKEVAQLKSRIAKLQGKQGVAEGSDEQEATQKIFKSHDLESINKQVKAAEAEGWVVKSSRKIKGQYPTGGQTQVVMVKKQGVAEDIDRIKNLAGLK